MIKRWLKFTAVFGLGLLAGIVVVLAAHSFGRADNGPELLVASSTQPTTAPVKQLWHCGMHPQVIQDHPGNCPICHMPLTPMKESSPSSDNQDKILYWWDPMLGPSSITDKPGKSAMGMDLVPRYAKDASAGSGVTIDPAVVQNMGIRTAVVKRGPLSVTVRAVGMINVPQPGLHDVSLKMNGWIETLHANTDGMHVHVGEVLFDVYSPDLQVAAEELISAVHASKAVTSANNEADGMVVSAKRKLKLWDVADEDIDAIAKSDHAPKAIPFRSPATGHVVDLAIVEGSAVQSGMKLLRIEDHSKLWLDAEVHEDQYPLIALGQHVSATIDGLPGMGFDGTVSFIYPHLDHMTRTATIRALLDNADGKLKPGMYATAQIVTQPVDDAILVPREAIIDTGTRQIAFVVESEGHFEPRKVQAGLVGDDGQLQILQGLAPGESVVTSGQFLIDVESRTTEAIEKLRTSQKK